MPRTFGAHQLSGEHRNTMGVCVCARACTGWMERNCGTQQEEPVENLDSGKCGACQVQWKLATSPVVGHFSLKTFQADRDSTHFIPDSQVHW